MAAAGRPVDVVLVDAVAAGRLSTTVLAALRDASRELDEQGVRLWLAALSPRALALVRRTPRWAGIAASGRAWRTTDTALAAYRSRESPASGGDTATGRDDSATTDRRAGGGARAEIDRTAPGDGQPETG